MISRKSPVRNQRRSGVRQRRAQNLLEVTVRSRQANRQRNRRILVCLCKIILAVGLVGGAVYGVREGLRRFLWENPEYNLAVVEIHDEDNGVSREAIMSAAKLELGKNVFGISLDQARKGIAALPQVAHVELRRVLPNKIAVELTERRPVAWLADSDAPDATASEKSFLIDARGTLFKPRALLPEYLRLPVIYGGHPENFLSGETVQSPEVQAALDLIGQNAEKSRFALKSVDISKGYCMVVTDAKRARITFGLDDIGKQLDNLSAVLDYAAGSHQEIRTVSLAMARRNIPVTFMPPPGEEPEKAQGTDKSSEKSVEKKAKTAEESSRDGEAESGGSRNGSSSRKPDAPHRKAASPEPKRSEPKSETRKRKTSHPAPRKKRELPVRRAEPVIRRALPVHPVRSLAPVATALPR